MTPLHADSTQCNLFNPALRSVARRAAIARCGSVLAPMLGAAVLAAGRPAKAPSASLTTGLRYDIRMTSTTATPENEQPALGTSGFAHVEIVNSKIRIDVAEGEFAGIASTGDFIVYTDTSHTVTIVKPDVKQYTQVDLQKLGANLTSTVNTFGAAIGVQASNVKMDFASLGPGDKVGPFATAKYRITQDYVLTVSFLGASMGKGTTMHSTTDYSFAPQLTMIVDPFVHFVQETAWLGADYGKQLASLQAKLPKGVPVKTILTDVATDSLGAKTTTTVTWDLSNFTRDDISDDVFQIPAGYTPSQGPTALLQPGASLTTGSPSPVTNALGGKAGLTTMLKTGQTGVLPGMPQSAGTVTGAANAAPGSVPTTTWNGNGSPQNGTTQNGTTSSPWNAATSPATGQNASAGAPATTGQDTTKGRSP